MSDEKTNVTSLGGTGRVDVTALLEMAKAWGATDVVVIGIEKNEGRLKVMIGSSCPEVMETLAILELGREHFHEVRKG